MFTEPSPDHGHLLIKDGLFSSELNRTIADGSIMANDIYKADRTGVVFVYAGGPRGKTPAENQMWAQLGGQVNSMTLAPEVVLANELEIPVAALVVGHKYSVPDVENPKEEEIADTLVNARIGHRKNPEDRFCWKVSLLSFRIKSIVLLMSEMTTGELLSAIKEILPDFKTKGMTAKKLSGGNINNVWRVDGDPDSLIAKHAPPHIATNPDIPLSKERLSFEAKALSLFSSGSQLESIARRVVRPPKLLAFDPDRFTSSHGRCRSFYRFESGDNGVIIIKESRGEAGAVYRKLALQDAYGR